MEIMKFFGRGIAGLGWLLAVILLAGCASDGEKYAFANDPLAGQGAANVGADVSTNGSGNLLGRGDDITVTFSDIPNPPTPIEDTIKDDGSIILYFNEKFQAAGKTTGALQSEIRKRYVDDRNYYKYLTVSIATKDRFYYVGGEVRNPGRQIYSGPMTVVKAIDTAGGFTYYARKGRVKLIHNGQIITVDYLDAVKHPEKDRDVFPGDKIQVNKRGF